MPPRKSDPMPDGFPDLAHATLLKSGPMTLREFAAELQLPRLRVYRWMVLLAERRTIERVGWAADAVWKASGDEAPARPHSVKRRVVDLVRARPGIGPDEVAAELGLVRRRAEQALWYATKIGDLVRVPGKVSAWYVAGAEPVQAVGSEPSLVPGWGPKLDCAHYEACLFRFVARFPRQAEGQARCMPGCSAFKPFPHHVDLLAATRRRFDGDAT